MDLTTETSQEYIMDLSTEPSLQHLATIKYAFTLYNADIVDFIGEVTPKEDYEVYNHLDIDLKEESWIREVQQKARISFNQQIPKKFEDMVINVLYSFVSEIHYWLRDHFHIIKHTEKNQYKNSLCWDRKGTIDRTRTAEQFIRNESIDKRVRFLMACIYFQQTDVLQLWQGMTEEQRQTIFYADTNIAVHFWMEWLTEDATSPWTQCVSKYLTPESLIQMFPKSTSRVRLSSFFMELEPQNKITFFMLWHIRLAHSDDFLRCYNLMDQTVRVRLIPGIIAPIDVLFIYLNGPLQSLFMDAVIKMKRHLTRYCFEYCLGYIVYRKLMRGVNDFNYLQLLKALWNEIPDTQKEEIQRQRIFPAIQAAMSYDEETHHMPIEELLKGYLPSAITVITVD